MNSNQNQIVHVEFDSYANSPWGETTEHVGINNNSIISSVLTPPWNASYHSGETIEVWISYNSTTTNLTVSWKYQTTSNPQEKTSLSYQIDLMKVLPEWVTVGFSASTGTIGERHNLLSWKFSSTLEQSENDDDTKKRSRKQKEEAMHLRSMNDDLERGIGPRGFTYEELDFATHNFSIDRKLGQGGFGAVYKGYFFDLDLQVAVKKISRESRQGKKEYVTCSGLGLELAQSRYARRDKAHKSLLGDLALWLRSAYGAHSSPRHKELVAPLQQVQPPPPLVIAAFCSPQPVNSTKDSSSEGFAGPQPFLINRLDQWRRLWGPGFPFFKKSKVQNRFFVPQQTFIAMASASNTHNINNDDQTNDHVDFVPTRTSPERYNTVLSPVRQPNPESDPRDGQFTPVSSGEDDNMQIITERQAGKRPQITQEIPVVSARPADQQTDLQRILALLEDNNRLIAQQNLRIEALEKQRPPRAAHSPPRRQHLPESPPRQEIAKQRRPALERIQPPSNKRGRTPPPREDRVSPITKKGKGVEQPRHSPQGLRNMARQGGNSTRPARNDYEYRSPTPVRRYDDDTLEISPTGSEEEHSVCALSREIMRAPIPAALERLPNLPSYDGLTDPDDHVQALPHNTKEGSPNLPKTVATLEAIFQGPKETLRAYIERFNREAVQVEEPDDMKRYLLVRGLRPRTDFAKAVGIEKPRTLAQLLAKAESYIQYEEQEIADALRQGRSEEAPPKHDTNKAPRESGHRDGHGDGRRDGNRDGGRRRGERPRGPPSLFTVYTPLNASREHILLECYDTEFKEGQIKFPKPGLAKPGQDKSKWCRYHRSHGHVTEDCIHQKDAIETLIRQGRLGRFRAEESPKKAPRQAANVEEEYHPASASGQEKKVVLSISRP
ncbi:L-type lectin-domain containing receptor kinase IX.1 [Trifolium repens]|nr:L-type lectin-domain containing receptor kinase IX.1 [Trifolium repens]